MYSMKPCQGKVLRTLSNADFCWFVWRQLTSASCPEGGFADAWMDTDSGNAERAFYIAVPVPPQKDKDYQNLDTEITIAITSDG